MYRGQASPGGRSVAIYGDEERLGPALIRRLLSPRAPPARARARAGLVGIRPRDGRADRLAERRPAHPRRDRPAARPVAPARHPDLPGAHDRADRLLARLHQDLGRPVQLRLVLALSEYRHLPSVRPRSGLPGRQLRHQADRAQRAPARRPHAAGARAHHGARLPRPSGRRSPPAAPYRRSWRSRRQPGADSVRRDPGQPPRRLGRLSRRARHFEPAGRRGRHPFRARARPTGRRCAKGM